MIFKFQLKTIHLHINRTISSMKKSTFHLIFFLFGSSIIFSSCKKDCVIEGKDTFSGDIITSAVIFTDHGLISSKFPDSTFVVDSLTASNVQNYFTVRFNQGAATPVDYSKYNIMGYPTNTDCSSIFDRKITINHVAQTVTYSITITHCDDCEGDYTAENWVLVPKFPLNYEVIHDVKYINNAPE